ncbi:hypothetical protein UFOVP73_20 [uncultured Caudovirales phage]|uniref:Uncharacterized protein n=1 Tax=uncultured Caudovirales phage TaxID=2100421 RepID=A0A6J5KXY1_9CAUD|nr:hypothetical protein UFOVP73_20 [uncultured Caudovirales phage]CAB5195041.1 hypothetical protein UFOVP170_42 [uncultured Caudovirales phage]
MSSHRHALNVMQAHSEQFPADFAAWLKDNPDVWLRFCDEAVAIHKRGFSHYSSKTIIHVLRHHSSLHEESGPWKLNNNHTPYLARLFDLTHPDRRGMWEYRETKRVTRGQLDLGGAWGEGASA